MNKKLIAIVSAVSMLASTAVAFAETTETATATESAAITAKAYSINNCEGTVKSVGDHDVTVSVTGENESVDVTFQITDATVIVDAKGEPTTLKAGNRVTLCTASELLNDSVKYAAAIVVNTNKKVLVYPGQFFQYDDGTITPLDWSIQFPIDNPEEYTGQYAVVLYTIDDEDGNEQVNTVRVIPMDVYKSTEISGGANENLEDLKIVSGKVIDDKGGISIKVDGDETLDVCYQVTSRTILIDDNGEKTTAPKVGDQVTILSTAPVATDGEKFATAIITAASDSDVQVYAGFVMKKDDKSIASPDEGYIFPTDKADELNGRYALVLFKGEGEKIETVKILDIKRAGDEVEEANESILPTEEPTAAPTETPLKAMNFKDVKESDWFYAPVQSVYSQGIITGVSDTEFAPQTNVTRAMLATTLWRIEGQPVVNYAMTFKDIDNDSWYTEAVRWAQSQKIITGFSDTEFGPNETVTREQAAVMIMRYIDSKGKTDPLWESTNLLDYDDCSQISDWAMDSMIKACGAGIISGKSETTLNPLDKVTRAELAQIIVNCQNNIK